MSRSRYLPEGSLAAHPPVTICGALRLRPFSEFSRSQTKLQLSELLDQPLQSDGLSGCTPCNVSWPCRIVAIMALTLIERPITANMMAIDATWRRACTLNHVSDTGAKLLVEGSVQDFPSREFFLVLSSLGLAYRRCELAWVTARSWEPR